MTPFEMIMDDLGIFTALLIIGYLTYCVVRLIRIFLEWDKDSLDV